MKCVKVRFFASLVDQTDCNELTVEIENELAAEPTVDALWQLLVQRYPGLSQLSYRPLVACDQRYADWNSRLQDVAEVAFLPPVSGG